MKYSRMFMFLVLMAAAAASFGAYNAAKPADNEYVADVPALVRENFRAIKDDAIVNAGTVAGFSVGNASGNIPRSNGTLNTNLNADLLDGFHASAFNASDALLLRLNGSRAMTGSLKFSGNYGILQSTSDGADNGLTSISGGGGLDVGRGGHLQLFGNEYSGAGGQVCYHAGNVSTGNHVFYTGAGTERFRIAYDGNSGFGTASPKEKLVVSGVNVKPVIGTDSHTVLYPAYDSQNATALEIHAGNTGTNFAGLVLSNSLTSSYGGVIGFATTGTAGTEKRYALIIGAPESDSSVTTNGMLSFHTALNGTTAEAMRITKNRNLLIGTTTDDGTNKLQVNGGIAAAGNLTHANAVGVMGKETGGSARNMLYMSNANIVTVGNTSNATRINSNGTLTHNGNTVWTAASDGAGSGLDADLLDGNSSAYFLPASSYTASDVLTKIKTVDGSGSGLEADKIPLTAPSTPANGQIWLQ